MSISPTSGSPSPSVNRPVRQSAPEHADLSASNNPRPEASRNRQPSLSFRDANTLVQENFPNAARELEFNLMINSLGHTLWGSKPVQWVSNREGWPAIRAVRDSGAPVHYDFVLMDGEPLGISGGFIVNYRNLTRLINEHPDIVNGWESITQADKARGSGYLFQLLSTPNPKSAALLNDAKHLGELLGYGKTNADNWVALHEAEDTPREERERLEAGKRQSRVLSTAEAIYRQDKNPWAVRIPGFVAWDDSPETEPLVTQYLEDSWAIRDRLQQRYSGGPIRNFLVKQILMTLFQFPSSGLNVQV